MGQSPVDCRAAPMFRQFRVFVVLPSRVGLDPNFFQPVFNSASATLAALPAKVSCISDVASSGVPNVAGDFERERESLSVTFRSSWGFQCSS